MKLAYFNCQNLRHEWLTIRVSSQPESISGGKSVIPEPEEYTVLGIFIPVYKRRLITTKHGDFIGSIFDVQIPECELDRVEVESGTLVKQVKHGATWYTVIKSEDYTSFNGCFQYGVSAEVDSSDY